MRVSRFSEERASSNLIATSIGVIVWPNPPNHAEVAEMETSKAIEYLHVHSEGEGRTFESCRVRHSFNALIFGDA
jgi:hypothetical protein